MKIMLLILPALSFTTFLVVKEKSTIPAFIATVIFAIINAVIPPLLVLQNTNLTFFSVFLECFYSLYYLLEDFILLLLS